MAQEKLDDVLEKIISLTSERDSSALELALAQTLFSLADVKHMMMHSAGNIERVRYALSNGQKLLPSETVPTGIIDALCECLTSSNTSSTVYQGKRLTLFPLECSKKQPLAVIVIEETDDKRDHDLAIQILKIYHNFVSLMNDNERDTLTGLLNRKTFDLKINNIITDLQNNQHQRKDDANDHTYLAIFDIDHFKRVNDNHGHLIGDEVLLLFSRMMDKNFRDTDFLFRFGGEEFVGVYHCPDNETMTRVLNRFRKVIEGYAFPQVGSVTVSCGFTQIDALDLTSSIMDRADTALYHAKNNGRNQVCHHEKLVALGLLAEEDNSGGDVELF